MNIKKLFNLYNSPTPIAIGCLGVSDYTSPWGRSELRFRNSGRGKYKISVFGPKAKMIPIAIGTAEYPDGSALGIVGFKKFFIILWFF